MTSIPAKISRPILPKILPRTRLFRQLDNAAQRQVVWLSAPAGSGKTTLVASYLDDRRLPCLWYQVDERDTDIATFFYYLGLAAEKALPRSRRKLPLFTPEYLHGISAFTRRYFEELFGCLKTPYAVVLDNYQDAQASAAFQEVVRDGLSIIPQGLTIILISRSAPPKTLARFNAERTMMTLTWEDIRLTHDEMAGVAALYGDISEETVSFMQEMTQGWTAGVILMAGNTFSRNSARLFSTKADPAEVFDYLAEEVLSKAEGTTREFLLETAFLPTMTPDMAQKLTGSADAGRLLADFARNNYFTQKHSDTELIYQYHPLFRDFLQTTAKQILPPSQLTDLQVRAATLLEEAGKFEDAALLLRDAGNWPGFIQLSLRQARPLISQGRGKTLEEWLVSIPKDFSEKYPWIPYWLGICKLPFDLMESRSCFQCAFGAFEQLKDPSGLYLSWCGIIDTYVYAWSDFTPLDQWIVKIAEIRSEYPAYPSEEVEAHVSYRVFCSLMYRQPHHPDLPFWEERTRHTVLNGTDIQLRMTIGSHLLFYYTWWTGEQAKAALLINVLRPAARSQAVAPLTYIVWRAIEAAYLWVIADNHACMDAVRDGLKAAEETGVHLWDFMLCAQGVYGTLSSGDIEGAGEFLNRMAPILNTDRRLDISHYHFQRAWEALCRQNLSLALEHSKTSVRIIKEAGTPFLYAFCSFGLAELLIERGEYDEAMKYIGEARRIGVGFNSKSMEYHGLMLEAVLHLRRQEYEAALSPLRGHLAVSREYGMLNHVWWRSSVMTTLYIMALEAGIEEEHVRELIRKRNLIPEAPPVHLENWPWPVKIYSLGQFSIVKDGEPLRFSGKVQQKPLALLKTIVALGGKNVAIENLIDLLWPDADGDDAYQSFTTTLHRLRKLLENDKAIQLIDGKVTLDPRQCWIDTWEFERLFGEVENITEKDAPEKLSAHVLTIMKKAIHLYTGHFLAGEPGCQWAISLRERLRLKALRLISNSGAYHEYGGDWRTAAECYMKGLDIDDQVEEFHQRLMICHSRDGRPGEALAVYTRCRKVLASIGVKPSPKTHAMYEALLDGRDPGTA